MVKMAAKGMSIVMTEDVKRECGESTDRLRRTGGLGLIRVLLDEFGEPIQDGDAGQDVADLRIFAGKTDEKAPVAENAASLMKRDVDHQGESVETAANVPDAEGASREEDSAQETTRPSQVVPASDDDDDDNVSDDSTQDHDGRQLSCSSAATGADQNVPFYDAEE